MARKQDAQARLGWTYGGGEFAVAPIGPNRKAADKTVTTIRGMQRLEAIDDALVMAFRMLAEAVDHDPTNAALWREYRSAEVALRMVGSDGGGDELSRILAEMSTAVGDTKNA